MPLHAPEMRAVRVAGFGGAVAALTMLGHALGGGSLPLVAALQVLALAFAGAAALMTRGVVRLRLLVPFVLGFQLGGHWVLTRMTDMSGHTGGGCGHLAGGVGAGAGAGLHGPAAGGGGLDPAVLGSWWPQADLTMTLAHVGAGLLLVALAWRSDAALAAFEQALRRAIDVVLGPGFRLPVTGALRSLQRPPATPRRWVAKELWLLASWRLRGPPNWWWLQPRST